MLKILIKKIKFLDKRKYRLYYREEYVDNDLFSIQVDILSIFSSDLSIMRLIVDT